MNQTNNNWREVKPSHCDNHITEAIERLVNEAPDGSMLIEIGAFTGASTVHFTNCIEASGKDILLLSIDPHLGTEMTVKEEKDYKESGTFKIWKDNVSKYGVPKHVKELRSLSVDAFRLRSKSIFKYKRAIYGVFLDGDHSYSNVINELYCYKRIIADGGVICGHDYFAMFRDSVVKAVNDFAAWNGYEIERISQRHADFGHGEPFCWWINI